jgi:hypothetical protein
MRGLFSLVGLLVVLAVVGMLVKKQMTSVRVAVPSQQMPAEIPALVTSATGNVAQQSQQIQQQVKQAMESAMQARPMPEEKP